MVRNRLAMFTEIDFLLINIAGVAVEEVEGSGLMQAIANVEVHDKKIAKLTFISGKRTSGETL